MGSEEEVCSEMTTLAAAPPSGEIMTNGIKSEQPNMTKQPLLKDPPAPSNGEAVPTVQTEAEAKMDLTSTPASTSQYLVVFHAISAGLNGAALGSDEADIVNLIYIIIDVEQNKVRNFLKAYIF